MINDNIVALYERYPVIKTLDLINNEEITKQVAFKNLLIGDYLNTLKEGCPGFLFVVKGEIRVNRVTDEGHETNLYSIREGEFCHEALSCMLNYDSLNIVAKAKKNSLVALVPYRVFKKYFLEDKAFLKEIYTDLYKKLNNIIINKEEMIHDSLESRLIKLLMNKNSRIIYTTHGEIALELDSSREVISRKLKELEKRGYLKISRGKIEIVKELIII